jgi:hypothetical protein
MENSDNISLAWNIADENAKSIHPSSLSFYLWGSLLFLHRS